MCSMNSNKIQAKLYSSQNFKTMTSFKGRRYQGQTAAHNPTSNVSFQGSPSEFSKHGWFALRQLSDKMKNASEITNALIAAIGTGIIAPLIILVSPGKGDKEDSDKKFFQAIRQPLSAGLALAFQLPATMAVNKFINHLAYDKKIKLFRDDIIGDLIPDKKYLRKQVSKDELKAIENDFEKAVNGESLKQKLENKIRKEYEEAGLGVSDEKIAQRVAKEKNKFLIDEIVDKKHKSLVEEKIKALKGKSFDIKDADLVTDDNRLLAIHRNKDAYNAIEKKYKLSAFDKLARLMGFSTPKVSELEKEQKNFATEKGLEILKAEDNDLLTNTEKKFKRFVENQEVKSKKVFANKKFWLSLLVNLFMVTASCYALNWAHPRFKEFIDNMKHKNDTPQQTADEKKVEVQA